MPAFSVAATGILPLMVIVLPLTDEVSAESVAQAFVAVLKNATAYCAVETGAADRIDTSS